MIARLCPVARSNFGPRSSNDRLHPEGAQHFEFSGRGVYAMHKRKMNPILPAARSERIFMAASCEMGNLPGRTSQYTDEPVANINISKCLRQY